MRRQQLKKIAGFILVVVMVVAVLGLAHPGSRNALIGAFRRDTNNTVVTNPTEGEETTETTAPTTEETTPPTEEDASKEDVSDVENNVEEEIVEIPFTFAQFVELATTNGMWNVAPEKAVIYDMTADEFVAENESEKTNYVAVMLRVNPYGAMSIVQEGFENVENHTGKVVAPNFEYCSCKKGFHNHSWNADMGQFHWNVAEGNMALGAKSWTRMMGENIEVLMNFDEREMIRNVACYWFVENENGVSEVVYGVRVCGDQKDPVAPKPPVEDPKPGEGGEEEEEMCTINFNFMADNGANLPEGVMSQLPAAKQVAKGESYKVNFTFKAVEEANGTWVFVRWDNNEFVVNGNVTVTGTWHFEAANGGEEPEPAQKYNVNYVNKMADGSEAPSFLDAYLPEAEIVEAGTRVTPKAMAETVHVVDEATRYVFVGWNVTEVTVNSDVTFEAIWELRVLELADTTADITYTFVVEGMDTAPEVLNKYLPAATTAEIGTIYEVEIESFGNVEADNYIYTFKAWNVTSFEVTADTTVIGTWTREEKVEEPAPKAQYTINFVFEGENLPEAVTKLLPEAITVEENTMFTAPAIANEVLVENGSWKNNGWDKNEFEVTGDTTVTMKWNFEENEPEYSEPVPETYQEHYSFIMKDGSEVPEAVMNYLPKGREVVDGETVKVQNLGVEFVAVDAATRYVFLGWNMDEVTVNGNDITFVGTWEIRILALEEPVTEDFVISYVAVSVTEGKNIPASVQGVMPTADVVLKGETWEVPSPVESVVPMEDGKWEFIGWNVTSFEVTADTEVIGYWTWVEDNTPEYSEPENDEPENGEPEYSEPEDGNNDDNNNDNGEVVDPTEPSNPEQPPVEDNNPVADNQEEIDEAVGGDQRTDDVPEEDNTPEFSEQPEDDEVADVTEPVQDNDDADEEITDNGELDLAEPVEDEENVADDGHSPVADENINDDARNDVDDELSLEDPVEEETEEVVEEAELELPPVEDQPIDDSVVADEETQEELDNLFPGRE